MKMFESEARCKMVARTDAGAPCEISAIECLVSLSLHSLWQRDTDEHQESTCE